jgi:predicted aspartyl protease
MITGTVNPLQEARIPLTVRGPGGHEEDIEAVIDTGFTGWLTLPPALIAAMGLTWRGRDSAILADGRLPGATP